MPKEHNLEGLEPDNLLGFLALLGFHRALEHVEQAWRPRVYWTGLPLRPMLVLSEDVSRINLLEAAAKGCEALAVAHSFEGRKDLTYGATDIRKMMEIGVREASPENRLRIDLLSALTSDVARKKDDTVRATPFCAMFGQGHQHFLERLETIPKGIPPKELVKEVTQADLNSLGKIEEAVFAAWNRRDRTQSFRWDPLEDRRYALRFEDPSSDKGMTIHGANRLASLALPLLPAMPRRERGEVRLYAIGTRWSPGGGLQVSWPIWTRPATLRSVLAMVAVCGNEDLCPGLGISAIYSSERISVGKFFNFTRALPAGRM
jgi:hypothetical protein